MKDKLPCNLPVFFNILEEIKHDRNSLYIHTMVDVTIYNTKFYSAKNFYKPISKMFQNLPYEAINEPLSEEDKI